MRRGGPPVTVDAENWIVAMGVGIQRMGGDTAIDRLACEMLPNGTVIARDVRTGVGYVIQPGRPTATPERELETSVDEVLPIPSEPSLEETIDDTFSDERFEESLARVAGERSPMEAWERALRIAREVVPCEAGTAVEATPHAGLFFVAVTGENASMLRAMKLPYGTGFVGFSIQHASALVVHDVNNDARHYKEVDQVTGFETRAVLVVPVMDEHIVYGCLELLNPTERFTRHHLELTERVAKAVVQRLFRAGAVGRRRHD